MEPAHPCDQCVELLALRRSSPAATLCGPGPDEGELRAILTMAARVPDHRRVTPFRFLVFTGEARERAGAVLKTAFGEVNPDATATRLGAERDRLLRAPTVVAVISSVDSKHKTPEWEQILTAGAACQNMLLASSAIGFAAQWITEWYAYDENVLSSFGLESHERVAGYVYIGTAREKPVERARPDLEQITRFW